MKMDLIKFIDGKENQKYIDVKFYFDKMIVNGKQLKFISPVELKGNIYKTDDGLFVNADILFEYKDKCDRCLTELKKQSQTVLSGNILNNTEDSEDEDILIIKYEKDILYLEEAVLSSIEFSLPMKSLCSENCKGLCPVCGKNLNNGPCNCKDNDIDPRLAKLKQLLD